MTDAEIVRLAAAKKLTVGMMLDMRDSGVFIKVRELVRAGGIGEIRAVALGGQHPLFTGKRAGWYHEAGKHGGTISDIAVHADARGQGIGKALMAQAQAGGVAGLHCPGLCRHAASPAFFSNTRSLALRARWGGRRLEARRSLTPSS